MRTHQAAAVFCLATAALMAIPLLDTVLSRLDSWFARKKSDLNNDPLEPLPRERSLALRRQIAALDVPPPLVAFVREQLVKAIRAWRSDPEATNVLLLLSRPVEPIAPVIEAALAGWNDSPVVWNPLLPCHHRPADPAAMAPLLSAVLEAPLPPAGPNAQTVALSLANLDQCFLRCIDGWSGIEHLCQVVQERREHFWLIGCSSWAWKFLDYVSQISSYFPEARMLPALDGAELGDWLAPVAADLRLQPPSDSAASAQSSSDPDASEVEADHWSRLAELSSGCSRIAAELWVEGLRMVPDCAEVELREIRPCLPDLPNLKDRHRYILHSLLIHGTLHRDHLAFSLGVPGPRLHPDLHWLLGEGLLQESKGELSVRPFFYPSLVRDLAINNFFSGEA